MTRENLVFIVAVVVSGVWAVVALAGLLLHDYTGLSIVTPVMLVVAGFLFALKRNGGQGEGGK